MDQESPRPAAEEDIVDKWEAYLEKNKTIPIEGQDELRTSLRSANQALRDRLSRLLNPRRAKIVHLSDEDFRELYFVTTSDNYSKSFGVWEAMAMFDETHGHYVQAQVHLLRRQQP